MTETCHKLANLSTEASVSGLLSKTLAVSSVIMLSISSRGIYSTTIVLVVLSSLTVAARFYIRKATKARLGIDDYTAFSGLVSYHSNTIIGMILSDQVYLGYVVGHRSVDYYRYCVEG